MRWLAGVDGCRAGWTVALVRSDGGGLRLHVLERFEQIATLPERPAIVAVDMPIGLPERIGANGRGPEQAVRPLLGERQSSVFSVPSRRAVFAEDWRILRALLGG
jgi:predicted RNase H-like nuclease